MHLCPVAEEQQENDDSECASVGGESGVARVVPPGVVYFYGQEYL